MSSRPQRRPVVVLSTLCSLLLLACVTLSVLYYNESHSRPEWKSLLTENQNLTDGYSTITRANDELRAENRVLQEQNVWLEEQSRLLNRTVTRLTSANLALTLESSDLTEQVVNLTSVALELTQRHQRLVQLASEHQREKLNMSLTIRRLLDAAVLTEEEARRLSDVNRLLRDELLHVQEKNQELLEINGRFQGEIRNLSRQLEASPGDECDEMTRRNILLQERASELQQRNLDLSSSLVKERERRNQTEADVKSAKKAYDALDHYCPVVNHKTKERFCRKCPDGWRLFENQCYYFSSRTLSWSSSRAWCRTQGGDLLIVNSEPEQRFVVESSRALTQSGATTRLWMGMTDAAEEQEWLWVDGSSVSAHTQFWLSRGGAATEPDDWKRDDPLGEDCGHVDASEKELESWMDGSCETPYRWICEKNV
ncbi:uncharacterized protein V6R79_007445 [Siganus canaliculatus]